MTTAQIRNLVHSHANVVSQRNGIFTVKKSYYWGVTKSGRDYADTIQSVIPNIEILDCGNHFHGFVGGAKAGGPQDSYLWAKFRVIEWK